MAPRLGAGWARWFLVDWRGNPMLWWKSADSILTTPTVIQPEVLLRSLVVAEQVSWFSINALCLAAWALTWIWGFHQHHHTTTRHALTSTISHYPNTKALSNNTHCIRYCFVSLSFCASLLMILVLWSVSGPDKVCLIRLSTGLVKDTFILTLIYAQERLNML